MTIALFYVTPCSSIVYIEESQVIISKTILHFLLLRSILSLDYPIVQNLTKCYVLQYFIWAYCKITHIKVSSLQMGK